MPDLLTSLRRLALSRKLHGHFRHRLGGPPLDIGVHPVAPHAARTAVHEIGHLLDCSGLGEADEFSPVVADLDARFREALAGGEWTGRKRSNIFGA